MIILKELEIVQKRRPILRGERVKRCVTLPYRTKKFVWKFCDKEGEGGSKISRFLCDAIYERPLFERFLKWYLNKNNQTQVKMKQVLKKIKSYEHDYENVI